MIDITVNALEKFTWNSPDIAHFMKVLKCELAKEIVLSGSDV